MSYPEHPDTIIIKNKYYPKGLTEIDIWNYYQKEKVNLLQELSRHRAMIFLATNENEFIVKRKLNNDYIKFSSSNYDKIMSGRTVSIHTTMETHENFCIVDIDTENWTMAKYAAIKTYETLTDASFFQKVEIRYTGKNSFHLVGYLARKINIDSSRYLLEHYLKNSDLKKEFTISHKRTKDIVNLDLWASNKYNGNFITLNSLSVWGLKCMRVEYNEIKNFEPMKATIK